MRRALLTFARKLIYLCSFWISKFLGEKVEGFVLCYHGISEDANDEWDFNTSKEDFYKQINYLFENFIPCTASDLLLYLEGKKTFHKPFFLLTFDDGYKSISKIREFIKSKDLHPLVFLVSDTEGINRHEVANNYPLLTTEEITGLKRDGWDFGCHSATHPDFENLTKKDAIKEVVEAKAELEKSLGLAIDCFAYPKGRYNKDVVESVKMAGYKIAFSMDNEILTSKNNPYMIPRAGVLHSHSFTEFKSLFLPLSVKVRKLLQPRIIYD